MVLNGDSIKAPKVCDILDLQSLVAIQK